MVRIKLAGKKGLSPARASKEAACLNNSVCAAQEMSRLRGNSAVLPPVLANPAKRAK
jgi:hypothetical protein